MLGPSSGSFRWWVSVPLAVLFALATAMAQGPGSGNGSGGGGGGGNGGGPPDGHGPPDVELVNYLSFPAAMTAGTVNSDGPDWEPPVGGGTLGVNYSYGCDVPDGEFPNTSCFDEVTGTFTTAAVCTVSETNCIAQPVSRIYWQKVGTNWWWAETTALASSFEATAVDWGDNLSAVSWKTTSVIRVETTPYATLLDSLIGYQMWHVSGHGPDEQWGVRATDSTTPQPYAYGADPLYPFFTPSIYTTTARLDGTKLGAAVATCPTSPGGTAPVAPTWNQVTNNWEGAGVVQVFDEPYTAELNVGGKYVHGYNLMMRNVTMPAGYAKAGWWRLTFYSSAVTMSPDAVTTPPAVPGAAPLVIAAEEEEGGLYEAVVDWANDISYIDICIEDQFVLGAGASGKVPPGKRKIPPGQAKKQQ